MLVVANLANTKWCKNPEKRLKFWLMGNHLRVLSESFLMNTNITGFRWFSKILKVALAFIGFKGLGIKIDIDWLDLGSNTICASEF